MGERACPARHTGNGSKDVFKFIVFILFALGEYMWPCCLTTPKHFRQWSWVVMMDAVYYFKTWRCDLRLPKTQGQ
jgi:hypothetical protein